MIIDIKDFGAKCDGLTDDSKAFQSACDIAVETGQTVFVPTGTTFISKTINVGNSNVQGG